jgi:hypothetical protein
MEVNFVLTAVIASLGLAAGIIIAHLAKSEIKPGEKYFKLLAWVLLAAIAAALIYDRSTESLIAAAVLLAMIATNRLYLVYAALGAALAVSASIELPAILIFVYGLPAGTLLKKQKNWKKQLAASIILLVAVSALLKMVL